MTWLRRLLGLQKNRVSATWLQQQERASWRAGFEGVSIRWPLNKIVNEHARFNTERLRRQASETRRVA